jgi:hypothetical protein
LYIKPNFKKLVIFGAEMKKILLPFLFLSLVIDTNSQSVYRKVLFLGNSYTFVNNLPGLVAALAHSAGDSLYYDNNSPGGYTLGWQPIAHSTDPVSLGKIGQGDWDFVVLQEQSQTPAIPALRDSCMYPGSIILHDSVKSANPCTRVLFFLTWGRRLGGIQCFTSNYCSPDFADFDQMQDSLTVAYKGIADSLGDWIAPVGEAWRYVINNNQVVLHAGDDSHPNFKGSYLAACVFYDIIFGKRSFGLSYYGGLADTAFLFQLAADTIVFGNPSLWNLWNDQPVAEFKTLISNDTMYTENLCTNSYMWHWDFGDGQTSDEFEPVHIFSTPGQYTVILSACDSCRCDSAVQRIEIVNTGTNDDLPKRTGIFIIGPDESGNLMVKGFDDEGRLDFYDFSGRLIQSVPVISGNANIRCLQEGLSLWILEDLDGNRVSQGKMVKW